MFKFPPHAIRSESRLPAIAQDLSIRYRSYGRSMAARHSPPGYALLLVVAALAVVITSVRAFAADYSVAYALEVDGKTETSKINNCNSVDTCQIKFRTIDATADLYYFSKPTGDDKIVLSMWGDSACCYFSDGDERISLDPAKQFHAVTIYAGHARRRNEVIRNQVLGVLYLSFAQSH